MGVLVGGANRERLRPQRDFGLRLSFSGTSNCSEINCDLREDRFWTPSPKDSERDFGSTTSLFSRIQVPPPVRNQLWSEKRQILDSVSKGFREGFWTPSLFLLSLFFPVATKQANVCETPAQKFRFIQIWHFYRQNKCSKGQMWDFWLGENHVCRFLMQIAFRHECKFVEF